MNASVKPVRVFVTDHAAQRFVERVSKVTEADAKEIIQKAVVEYGLIPGLWEPGFEVKLNHNGMKFRAVLAPAPEPNMLPSVTTILWPSFHKSARHIQADGYAKVRAYMPKHLLNALESKLSVTFGVE